MSLKCTLCYQALALGLTMDQSPCALSTDDMVQEMQSIGGVRTG